MDKSYIFDFCTLYNMEQAKDIKSYMEQSNNTIKAKLWK